MDLSGILVLGVYTRCRGGGGGGALARARDYYLGPEEWPLQKTCPSQDEKDLVGRLHSLTTTFKSFCKIHIPRLGPNWARGTLNVACQLYVTVPRRPGKMSVFHSCLYPRIKD